LLEFNVGIHPAQPAGDLTMQQIEKLVVEIKRILKSANTGTLTKF
jgi:formamidopyrimidine-DNA glycosylase